jgi:hypothetical protein
MKLVICQFICIYRIFFFISMSVICKLHFERIDRRTNLFEAVERVYLRESVIWFEMIVAALLITCDTFSLDD